MVEWAALEMRCARKGTVGSNPTLSARNMSAQNELRETQFFVCPIDSVQPGC